MAVRNNFASDEVLKSVDLNDTFAAKAPASHVGETLNVHGIADTSTLETQAGAQAKANAAKAAADTTAANSFVPLSQKGAAQGVATLDTGGKVPTSQLPPLAITESHVVADETAMLALDAQTGDIAIRTDNSKSFILSATPASNIANWNELLTPPNEVVSVDGRVGAVSLTDLYTPAAHADDTTGVHGIADTTRLVRDNAVVDFNNGDAGAVPVTITTADGQSASAFLVRRANGTSLLTLASTGYLSAVDVQASGGLRVGTQVTYSTGRRHLSVENTTEAPSSNPANGVIVYADNGRLLVRDDRGANAVATEAFVNAAPSFLGDWQAGQYLPGQLVASDGYLLTPRVATSDAPYSGGVLSADWRRLASLVDAS